MPFGESKEPIVIGSILERGGWLFEDIFSDRLFLQAKIDKEVEHGDTLVHLTSLTVVYMAKEGLLNLLRAST